MSYIALYVNQSFPHFLPRKICSCWSLGRTWSVKGCTRNTTTQKIQIWKISSIRIILITVSTVSELHWCARLTSRLWCGNGGSRPANSNLEMILYIHAGSGTIFMNGRDSTKFLVLWITLRKLRMTLWSKPSKCQRQQRQQLLQQPYCSTIIFKSWIGRLKWSQQNCLLSSQRLWVEPKRTTYIVFHMQ